MQRGEGGAYWPAPFFPFFTGLGASFTVVALVPIVPWTSAGAAPIEPILFFLFLMVSPDRFECAIFGIFTSQLNSGSFSP